MINESFVLYFMELLTSFNAFFYLLFVSPLIPYFLIILGVEFKYEGFLFGVLERLLLTDVLV